ncbi:hypothetical protein QAD02_019864 [Eretmocerus hayati]|uniref:Uncharacterized protein n=1 Tax=Eretmocerus hayati TaxID=131215 RepID=A0ACC2PP02_9HYME|nr:hypothetical protein QAD02_019864 [Eretmocerus hayati]
MCSRARDEEIHLAVREGNVELVKELLIDSSPNVQNHNGETPLHVACQFEDSPYQIQLPDRLLILKLLWDYGVKINAKDSCRQETALHIAVRSEKAIVVQFLLDHGANPDVRDKDDRTALHVVASATGPDLSNENETIAELLLQRGANFHAQDCRWRTPLIEAVCSRNAPVVCLLLKAGAQIDFKNRQGLSALFFACESQLETMVDILLQNRANPNLREHRRGSVPLHFVAGSSRRYTFADDSSNRSVQLAHLLLCAGADVDAVDASGSTSLHVAVDTKDDRLVEVLLAYGARPDVKDECGNTPMHVLMLTAQHNCCYEARLERIAGMLLNKCVSANELNEKLESPLHLAVWQGNRRIVAELLDHGANARALWHASRGSLQFLHESPSCNTPELCGPRDSYEAFTSLNVASALGHLRVVELLIDRLGRDSLESTNLTSCNGGGTHGLAIKTPLYFAIKNGHFDVAKLLLDAGCEVNRSILHGTTALHVAVTKGNTALTYLLLEHGANLETKDVYGRTALTCAVEYEKESLERVAKILVMYRVKREFRNFKANKEEVENIRSWQWLEDFRMDCFLELFKMKEDILCDNFSMYGILRRSIKSLAHCLSNENIANYFLSGNIDDRYPIYCDMLRIHFDLALERKNCLDYAKAVLDKLFMGIMTKLGFSLLPNIVVQRILDYCCLEDLKKIKSTMIF